MNPSVRYPVADKIRAMKARMSIPVIAAPMFLVTSPQQVIEACKAGVMGSLPALNARTLEILDDWLAGIAIGVKAAEALNPRHIAPWSVNLIAHKSNPRIQQEIELVVKYEPPVVILAWAKPGPIVDAIHGYGGLVFADVNSIDHARKAVAGGVDGLVLVAAGSGGHTGDLSPFAFVPAVREFFAGPIALGGAISDGRGVRAAEVLGADFANIGTRFIATVESLASEGYKQMCVECGTSDVVTSAYFTGVRANYLMPSIVRAGIDPAVLSAPKPAIELTPGGKAWKDVWSAGHGVFATRKILTTAEVVAALAREYAEARGTLDP